jgi:subtilisin family serine protease
MTMSLKRWTVLLTVLSCLSANGWAASLVICQMKYNTGADANQIASQMGGTIVDSIPGGGIYLMSMESFPSGPIPDSVNFLEVDRSAALPQTNRAVISIEASGREDWYRSQPAMNRINVARALSASRGRGIVIADIDSAVDYAHPALKGVLTSGYDFVTGRPYTFAPSGSLNQSTSSFLDQSASSFLDQSTSSFLDQSAASFLDQGSAVILEAGNPAHGHGTMVAGIMAAISPESMIMPLRAFDDDGQADVFTIAKAIGFAVEHGASVINMSFGLSEDSPTVREAIAYAQALGVVVVASAGNDNTADPQFPAAYPGVIAIASTDLWDRKAAFSNYGSDVGVSAPGVNIVSAYWGGYYSIASGTSFSAPMVSAEAALLLAVGLDPQRLIHATAKDINDINPDYKNQLGDGRIDLYQAVINGSALRLHPHPIRRPNN